MRPAFRVLRAVAALGAGAAFVVPLFVPVASAADETVMVGENNENKFAPATVFIKPGDTVTWQYAGGTDHTVTSTTSNWSKNDPVGPPAVLNFTTTYTFDTIGTYRYVCSTHKPGMKGVVVVQGKATPSPTRTPTRSPSPTVSRSPSPSSSSPSVTPSPSAGTATPVLPSTSVTATPSTTPPFPTVAPPPGTTGTPFLGSGGLTPQPATGRNKGLPAMLALLFIGGVGAAELRALLANAPR